MLCVSRPAFAKHSLLLTIMALQRAAVCQRPLQLRSSVRVTFGALRAPAGVHLVVGRSAGIEQTVTDSAAAATVTNHVPTDAASAAAVRPAQAQDPEPSASQDTGSARAEEAPNAAQQEHHGASESATGITSDGPPPIPVVKIGATCEVTKTAAYIKVLLSEISPGTPVLVKTMRPRAVAMAIRVMARLTEMVQESDSSSTISFQPRRNVTFVDTLMGKERQESTNFWVLKTAASDFDAELPSGTHPMVVRDNTEDSRVTDYILYRADNTQVDAPGACLGQLSLTGSKSPDRFATAVDGVIQARRKWMGRVIRAAKKKLEGAARKEFRGPPRSDLTVTIVKSAEPLPGQAEQQQQQQQQAPEAAAEAEAAVDIDDVSLEGQWRTPTPITRYHLRIYVCQPIRATRGIDSSSSNSESSSRRQDQAGSTGISGARPSASKAGVIEVPEAEWLQLKEQLELVPHLTEQLQVMTRQHEQLLSLLAAQQQQPAGQQEHE